MKFRVTLCVETEVEVDVEAKSRAAAIRAAEERFLKMPAAHVAGGFCSDWWVAGARAKQVDE
jgi:hypothetical protein